MMVAWWGFKWVSGNKLFQGSVRAWPREKKDIVGVYRCRMFVMGGNYHSYGYLYTRHGPKRENPSSCPWSAEECWPVDLKFEDHADSSHDVCVIALGMVRQSQGGIAKRSGRPFSLWLSIPVLFSEEGIFTWFYEREILKLGIPGLEKDATGMDEVENPSPIALEGSETLDVCECKDHVFCTSSWSYSG